jgi:hypothetical protein
MCQRRGHQTIPAHNLLLLPLLPTGLLAVLIGLFLKGSHQRRLGNALVVESNSKNAVCRYRMVSFRWHCIVLATLRSRNSRSEAQPPKELGQTANGIPEFRNPEALPDHQFLPPTPFRSQWRQSFMRCLEVLHAKRREVFLGSGNRIVAQNASGNSRRSGVSGPDTPLSGRAKPGQRLRRPRRSPCRVGTERSGRNLAALGGVCRLGAV